jgi:hypothetical protein
MRMKLFAVTGIISILLAASAYAYAQDAARGVGIPLASMTQIRSISGIGYIVTSMYELLIQASTLVGTRLTRFYGMRQRPILDLRLTNKR